eukprot:3882706-Pleurochrysis_carterae.AAC.1
MLTFKYYPFHPSPPSAETRSARSVRQDEVGREGGQWSNRRCGTSRRGQGSASGPPTRSSNRLGRVQATGKPKASTKPSTRIE